MSNYSITQDQADLLNYDFGTEMEKAAAEQAEVIGTAYDYGFAKLAADHADAQDKEEEEEEKEEHKKEGSARMDLESEKIAAEIGAFIERGYFDGLKKLGQERRGDEMYYIEPILLSKFANELSREAGDALLKGMEKLRSRSALSRASEAVGRYHRGAKENLRKAVTGEKSQNIGERITAMAQKLGPEKSSKLWKSQHLGAGDRAAEAGKAALKMAPHALVAGGAGYGGYKALSKKKKDDQ